jgi:hypothetical protein
MIIFKIQKKLLVSKLKQLKIFVKGSDRLNFKLKVFIRKGKAVFTIIGSEITIEIEHEGFGSFEMYFLDFYDAVNSTLFSLYDDISFIVEPKMIQIGSRKLSLINANFSTHKQKTTSEAPLGFLNYVEENNLFTPIKQLEFCLKSDEYSQFPINQIHLDTHKAYLILKKYNISDIELSQLVQSKLKLI